jgi:hypothetical protein
MKLFIWGVEQIKTFSVFAIAITPEFNRQGKGNL